jgi:hypothetical protein
MSLLRVLTTVCSAVAVFWFAPDVSAVAVPGKKAARAGGKNGGGTNPALRSLRKFDSNQDGQLDSTEKDALRSAFKSGDAALKTFDTNGDGDLDENEVAALTLKSTGKDGKPKKQKSGKNPAASKQS